jgi:hypothetical protein
MLTVAYIMAKVITFSRVFPKGHPKQGQETFFVEKVLKSINPNKIQSKLIVQGALHIFNSQEYLFCKEKNHTIRSGKRFKKGDFFSPRVWSGKPYRSKQITLFEDAEIKKVWDIEIYNSYEVYIDGVFHCSFGSENWHLLCLNDGLTSSDMRNWFSKLPFKGQIICWNDAVSY